MASAPPQLLWEIVKGNSCFLRKNLHGNIFSAEPGNLYNKHSYKYSGLANAKSVHVGSDGESLVVKKARSKTASQPAKAASSATFKKGNARKVLRSVGKDVASYRPDLKKAAVARASAVAKSLRVKKAAAKAK